MAHAHLQLAVAREDPAARAHPPAGQTLGVDACAPEQRQVRARDAQRRPSLQVQPDRAAAAADAHHAPLDDAEAAHAAVGAQPRARERAEEAAVAPDAQAAGARGALGGEAALEAPQVGRHGDGEAEPLADQGGGDVGAVGEEGVGEQPPVAVLALAPVAQPHRAARARDQGDEALARGEGERLRRAAVAAELRRVDADQAHAAAAFDLEGVAVEDVADAHARVDAVRGAGGRGGGRGAREGERGQRERATKKGARAGRPPGRGARRAAHFMPYLRRKRSTRPPVSTIFCLPV